MNEPAPLWAELPKAEAGRQAYWRQTGWIDCPLYRRAEIAYRQTIDGPAIIEEYGSTVVVPEGWTLRADGYANLILARTD